MKNAKIETLKVVLQQTQEAMNLEITKMEVYYKAIENSRNKMISIRKDLEYLESVVARIENDEE